MKLAKDTIERPGVWRLSLLVADSPAASGDGVDIVFFSPLEGHSLMHFSLPMALGTDVAAFEELVYDNPLLLADFERTDALVDTRRFMLVPSQAAHEETCTAALHTLWPDSDATVLIDHIPGCSWRMAYMVDSKLLQFVRRTFHGACIRHRLTPLAAWLCSKSGVGNTARVYVHLRPGGTDILAFSRGTPLLVNTFDATHPADIVYYVLACMQTCGMDPTHDEIHLCGQNERREAVAAALRVHASYVMPVVFPSVMYKAGKEAMDAPFELIVLPLCV